jgi:4-aminobutyrate aminotransferase
VRGIGLMIGVDLVRDGATREPATAERDAVLQECFRRGLVLLGCGEGAIRFCPALVVTQEETETAVQILDAALTETARGSKLSASSAEG